MRRKILRLAAWLLFASLAVLGATVRLYLKDGTYQLVREYEKKEDRVRYFSVERGEWEEIPLDLVDLKRTERETAHKEASLAEETKAVQGEEKAGREQVREVSRIPQNPGVYQVSGKQVVALKQGDTKVRNNKRRSVLKVLAPIPIITGKATLELDGEHSAYVVTAAEPEFYIQLSGEHGFGIIKLTSGKGLRVVENLTTMPVTNEVVEQRQEFEIFRQQQDEGLYKISPTKPLEPGEYAVVEYSEGKLNIQVWDFAYRPAKK